MGELASRQMRMLYNALSVQEQAAAGSTGQRAAVVYSTRKVTQSQNGHQMHVGRTIGAQYHRKNIVYDESSGILARASAERRGRHAARAAGGTNRAVENERTRKGTARKTYQALQPRKFLHKDWLHGMRALDQEQVLSASARRGLACRASTSM